MKTLFTAAVAAVLMTGTAYAADLIVDDAAPSYSSSVFDWSGFYLGVNAGYGGGTFEHPLSLAIEGEGPVAIDGSIDVTAGGFVGGAQAGYNAVIDDILLGIEGDIQGSTIDARVSAEIGGDGDELAADIGTSLDWFATIRPRIGFVQDRFVVYATGGLAWGRTTSSINAEMDGTPLIEDASVTNDRFGWTIGGGIEYALTDTISLKTEYLYTDLRTENLITLDGGEGGTATLDSKVAFHTVRAGLNFHF